MRSKAWPHDFKTQFETSEDLFKSNFLESPKPPSCGSGTLFCASCRLLFSAASLSNCRLQDMFDIYPLFAQSKAQVKLKAGIKLARRILHLCLPIGVPYKIRLVSSRPLCEVWWLNKCVRISDWSCKASRFWLLSMHAGVPKDTVAYTHLLHLAYFSKENNGEGAPLGSTSAKNPLSGKRLLVSCSKVSSVCVEAELARHPLDRCNTCFQIYMRNSESHLWTLLPFSILKLPSTISLSGRLRASDTRRCPTRSQHTLSATSAIYDAQLAFFAC